MLTILETQTLRARSHQMQVVFYHKYMSLIYLLFYHTGFHRQRHAFTLNHQCDEINACENRTRTIPTVLYYTQVYGLFE
jgi:hypothetical protein